MHKYIPILVIIILAVSLVLKSERYLTTVPSEQDKSIEEDIALFLRSFGWSETKADETSNHKIFQTFSFAKKGCDNLIAVAVLGDNTELENFARISMGGDVGLFQNGQFVTHQSASNMQIANARLQLSTIFGQRDKPIPVIAISPKPHDEQHDCAPPAKKHWNNWASRHIH